MEFTPFPKIPRWKRELVVTEKIDGTNASIGIFDASQDAGTILGSPYLVGAVGTLAVFAGARTSWRTPEKENFGFARWVRDHIEELATLGPGTHFGEWWGPGIQRGYGIPAKRFSLFNAARWGDHNPGTPACCGVVPVLYRGESIGAIELVLEELRAEGSRVAPGWMKPEGVVIFHSAASQYFKRLLENDDAPKGAAAEVAGAAP